MNVLSASLPKPAACRSAHSILAGEPCQANLQAAEQAFPAAPRAAAKTAASSSNQGRSRPCASTFTLTALTLIASAGPTPLRLRAAPHDHLRLWSDDLRGRLVAPAPSTRPPEGPRRESWCLTAQLSFPAPGQGQPEAEPGQGGRQGRRHESDQRRHALRRGFPPVPRLLRLLPRGDFGARAGGARCWSRNKPGPGFLTAPGPGLSLWKLLV